MPPVAHVYRRYGHETSHNEIIEEVLTRCLELLKSQIANSQQGTPLDHVQILETVASEFGPSGIDIASSLIESIALQLHITPWAPRRWFDWDNTVDLRDLFLSESLETKYGTFFDQRFVDYLSENFRKIDEINWRKFEGLTAEFFERSGFKVKIGPGRGDGGD